jgi:hypothetical protein
VGAFDAISNWAAYTPLGFAVVMTVIRWNVFSGWRAALLACVFGFCLSLSLEALQTFHPLRVPSMWDVALNTLGTATGAALCIAWLALYRTGNRGAHRSRWLTPRAGAVCAVLGLWALAQLHPQGWVFVSTPLRSIWPSTEQGTTVWPMLTLPLASFATIDPSALARLESLAAALSMVSVLGLLRSVSWLSPRPLVFRLSWMVLGWLMLLAWEWAAYALQFVAMNAYLAWGAGVWTAYWVAGGFAILFGAISALSAAVLTVASLGAYLLVVQMLPAHPYASVASVWQSGQFTHLFGLTALVSAVWPVLALIALVLQLRDARRGG